jgi:hypothetical protein
MLATGHGAADDLAVDELDALVGLGEQIGDGVALAGFHRLASLGVALGWSKGACGARTALATG